MLTPHSSVINTSSTPMSLLSVSPPLSLHTSTNDSFFFTKPLYDHPSTLSNGSPLFRRSHNNNLKSLLRICVINATTTSSVVDDTLLSPNVDDEYVQQVPHLLRCVSSDSLHYETGLVGPPCHRPVFGTTPGLSSALNYKEKIDSASQVYDVAVVTPLDRADMMSERLQNGVWLKREDLQEIFSFKLRGAYYMMSKLPKEQLEKGVICSSAGNHAQGVALASRVLGCDAKIVMPITTSEIKRVAVKRLGATVVLSGDSFDEAQAYAKVLAENEGRIFVPAFDHPDIIVGQGTVGMEILDQIEGHSVHAILVPIGGGGLIAGIASYVKMVRPEIKIIGVEPYDDNSMALSLHYGERIMLNKVGGFADGVAIKVVGEQAFHLCKELIDGVILVSHDAISAAIKNMHAENRGLLEPAGAVALAGLEAYCKYNDVRNENLVAVTTGANMNFDKLRLISELADFGRLQEALFATLMPEEPGSFKRFAKLVGPMNITEFKYGYSSKTKDAVVIYSVGVYLHTASELILMQERMESADLRTFNLTDNDVWKEHLRDCMGRSDVDDELLCSFVFPERTGALMEFLDAFSPRWNISLFHYRAQGETGANVLVGMQILGTEVDEFRERADNLGFLYKIESDGELYQLLMG